ncbi:MAG: hypothetical protein RMJ51_02540 [Candidatus Calescibacterium sp.]|nr:hypothetical protein [Candidatus Calescibacterium sp.]MCX7972291.1 hypothetical protein [bacterium]MDW8195105.1 hypothetical protein [Candidatus Calescibacterium sp.]
MLISSLGLLPSASLSDTEDIHNVTHKTVTTEEGILTVDTNQSNYYSTTKFTEHLTKKIEKII